LSGQIEAGQKNVTINLQTVSPEEATQGTYWSFSDLVPFRTEDAYRQANAYVSPEHVFEQWRRRLR
jgi:hypothetical protein